MNKKTTLIIAGLLILFFVAGIFVNQFNAESKSSEFSSCEDYNLKPEMVNLDSQIYGLMEAKKYQEVVNLGNKHLKDDAHWYCDNFFWIQRAEAFYKLNNCYQSIVAATHAIFVTPTEARKEREERLVSIENSDICVIKR